MLPRLPQELIDRIAYYLPFEKAIAISEYMKERLGEKADWKLYSKEGNLFGIKWMHYHEQLGDMDLDYAASRGQLEVVKWLHKNGKGCTIVAMNFAAGHGHFGCCTLAS